MEVECTECNWQGYAQELWCRKEDDDKPVAESIFNTCPQCEAEDTCEDIDDDDC